MQCRMSLQSIWNFIIIVTIVVGAWFVVYLLHPWYMPFIERNPNFIGGMLIVLLMYINIKMPNVNVFNVIGYVVFSACSLVAHGFIISLIIVLSRWLEVSLREHSFPWFAVIAAASIYAFGLNVYSCLVKRTLFKSSRLIKKVVRERHQ